MLKPTQKHAPQRTIAVDVDGTLIVGGELNMSLIEWCTRRKSEGFFLILWSARGMTHAVDIAEETGVSALFDVIISKPGYIVDDVGWSWIKFTKVHRDVTRMLAKT